MAMQKSQRNSSCKSWEERAGIREGRILADEIEKEDHKLPRELPQFQPQLWSRCEFAHKGLAGDPLPPFLFPHPNPTPLPPFPLPSVHVWRYIDYNISGYKASIVHESLQLLLSPVVWGTLRLCSVQLPPTLTAKKSIIITNW